MGLGFYNFKDDGKEKSGIYIIPDGMEKYESLRCYLPETEDYEVSLPAMRIVKEKYPIYKDRMIKIDSYAKAKGYYLSQAGKISVSADCFNSYKGTFTYVLPDLDKESYEDIRELLLIYKYVYHTIGNFIPIPRGCNTHTWGNGSNENFSKKMEVLKEAYKESKNMKESNISLELIEEKKPKEKLVYWFARDWEDWNDFCEKLYLQDFIDVENVDEEKQYNPRPFYTENKNGQCIRYNYIPKKYQRDEVINSINNCICQIIKRGIRIINEGKIKEEELNHITNEIIKKLKQIPITKF